MITVDAGGILATRYDLGEHARLEGPVARGQLGRVWRLTTDRGRYAVKEWFAGPDMEAARQDARLSDRARAAGVMTPRVIRTRDGQVTATVAETLVRLHEWVDLEPRTRRLDPAAVGATVARLHRAAPRTDEPVVRWFSDGFGPVAWYSLHERLVDAQAPFAEALAPYIGSFVEVESVMEPHGATIVCHRDLWADNVLATTDGQVCIIDFENLGPADPSHELAMVIYEFGDDDPERARILRDAYVDEGGPGRVTRAGHFTMLIAEIVHICHLAASRWVGEDDPAERLRLEEWFREVLEDPVSLPRIERILDALR